MKCNSLFNSLPIKHVGYVAASLLNYQLSLFFVHGFHEEDKGNAFFPECLVFVLSEYLGVGITMME